VLLDELLQRDTHLLLDNTGIVDVAANAVQLGTLIALSSEPSEPARSTTANSGGDGDSLNVGYSRGASEQPNISREGGLETGLSLLALQTLNESSLLSANVGSGSTVDIDVEIVSGTASVLADETSSVGFVDSLLDVGRLLVEFTTDVDVGCVGVHGAPRDETSFDELVGVTSEDFSVLAGSWFSLVGIDNEITGS
jgi:hypothetical protein